MKRSKPAEFDTFAEEQRAKRQLIYNLSHLSLSNDGQASKIVGDPDRMDIGDPNVVYVPDIDEFLDENTSSQVAFPILEHVLKLSAHRSNHYYTRPTNCLIHYEPAQQLLIRHLWKYLRHQIPNNGHNIDDGTNSDADAMEIDD